MRYVLSIIFSAVGLFAQCQNKPVTLYKVGYQNIFCIDSSRMYKPGSSADNKLHYRPLEIDLWYPAVSIGSEPVIEYGEFLQLLQQRSNRFQDDTVYKSMTTELLQYLCSGLDIADTFKLSHLKTVSYRNAKPVAQQFPLIIYMCSFNGMSYENIRLLENLAEHGYVVASVTSVGRYPGNMSTDPADLLEQEKDGLYTIEELRKKDNVDPGNVGVIGYSWGGLAGLLLAMNTDKVSAILSLDGSEMHYYGESAEEDKDFNQLRASPYFNLENIRVPYTYLGSGDKESGREVDSIFNIPSAQKRYIHFPGTEHEDFSCFPALAAQLATTKRNGADVKQLEAFPVYYFDRWLKGDTGALSAG
jgi:dienelactone hydrolase